MHAYPAVLLALAVWFIVLIVAGFSGLAFLLGPFIVSAVVLLACLMPQRRRTLSEGVLWSSLER